MPERYRVIVDDPEECKKILIQYYNNLSARYRGIAKTLEYIQHYYMWHRLYKDVKEYISAYIVYKKNCN